MARGANLRGHFTWTDVLARGDGDRNRRQGLLPEVHRQPTRSHDDGQARGDARSAHIEGAPASLRPWPARMVEWRGHHCRPTAIAITRIGPDQKLQVTESYEAGVSFFVWAEVPAWDMQPVPAGVETFRHLETFVAEAGRRYGLTQAFPFLITGSAEAVDFHVGNATPETPPGMEAALRTAVPFTLQRQQATYVGFWSKQHHGVFTHADQDIHVHLQTPDNKVSGHVDALRFGGEMQLRLPKA